MAVGLGTIVDSINLFLRYMFTGNLEAGETGKAPGQVFSAQGWYYNADGVRCDMSIDISSSPDANGAYAIFTASDYVVYTNPSVADMSEFDVTYYSAIAQLRSGQYYDWAVAFPGAWSQDYDVLTFCMDVDTSQSNWRITAENGGLPSVGGGGFTGMTLNTDAPIITNNQTFINNARNDWNNWQFIDLTDIEYNQHYTYNEIMNIIVPAVQVYYPDVSATDFISESDILATESETQEDVTDSTEPVEPFTLNYDEILSEDELESILTQETYEISEIESITETIIIDIEDLVIEDNTEYQQVTDFIPDALAVGMDIFNELNVSAPLTSAAIIACLWKIIRGT